MIPAIDFWIMQLENLQRNGAEKIVLHVGELLLLLGHIRSGKCVPLGSEDIN